ncbi:MAG: cytochrome c oxidase assembly factor Coa1 family protein [Planctomycetota bacterium]|nr:cytochrome c oxidase assembly factor Coa1 family protein [Planctomycetota bacterium]
MDQGHLMEHGHDHSGDDGGGRGRNFALGCFGLILVLLLSCVFWSMYLSSQVSGSEPYKGAVARAAKNSRVLELLGEGFDDGLQRAVSANSGESSVVTLEIRLTGSKGVGVLMVEGRKEEDRWVYERLELVFGEDRVNLLGS